MPFEALGPAIVRIRENCSRYHDPCSRNREIARSRARGFAEHRRGQAHPVTFQRNVYEVGRVLRYPRLQTLYGLSEGRVFDYITFLREAAEMVTLSPLLNLPSRDVNDIVVLQTAVLGEANILCTRDEDFFSAPAAGFLDKSGITVVDELALLHRLRS